MNKPGKILYRCRACNAAFAQFAFEDANQKLELFLGVAPGSWSRFGLTTHDCSPMITGIADFAGVQFDPAPSEATALKAQSDSAPNPEGSPDA